MPLVKFVGESEGQKRPKKQKLVKHRRKNWAKTDISDVERSIDDLRRQKLAGGILSEKKDEELFVINKKPIITKDELEAELESDKSVRRKGKKSLEEKLNNLSCYRHLKPDIISAPAHIVGHKKTPKPDSKRQAKIAETVEKKHKRKAVETKAKQAPKKAKLSKEKYDVLYETKPDDIWNGKEAPKETKEESNPETENDYLKPTKKVLVNKPKNPLHVESRNPKLELPHPGMSYNPEYDDHQRLLIQAHEAELKKLKKEEKELKKLTTSVNKMSWKEIEDLWLEEMSLKQGIDEQADEKDEEDESEKTSSLASNKSSKKKKEAKLKKKRKQILQKLKQKQKDNEKETRIQQSEIFRLKSLLKEINEEEKKREDKKLEKEIREKHRELFEPKRLGKVKFEAPDIDIKLSDELTGSLRTLKPEGNILMDSYKQLQKRNIIEPRERASKPKRRYGKKVFDKRNAHEKTYFIK